MRKRISFFPKIVQKINQNFVFSSIKDRISNKTNELISYKLPSPAHNLSQNLNIIESFNNYYYRNPLIFFPTTQMYENPSVNDFSQHLKSSKELLISQIKEGYNPPLDYLFAIYQFLFVFSTKEENFTSQMDRILLRRALNLDLFKEIELLWLLCLRSPEQRNNELSIILLQSVFKQLKQHPENIPKNTIFKAMICQIRLSYEIPRVFEKFDMENVVLFDNNIRSLDKFKKALPDKNLKFFEWIGDYVVLAKNKEKNIVYEAINLEQQHQEVLIYQKIKLEYLKKKNFEVHKVWINSSAKAEVQEIFYENSTV